MEYRKLGRSGVEVSPVCLGTMLFGSRTDEREAGRIVDEARAAGVNFIDTADTYNAGDSERIVGQLTKRDRERWVLATKVGNPTGDGPNQSGLGRRRLFDALEGSLRRLQTDRVDVYYLHRDDPSTPLVETLSAMGDLIRQGKVLHFGISNFRGWRVAEVVRVCEQLGIDRPICAQPYYNALNRMPEVDYLPACGHYGIGVVPYSPLARGVLTGKYLPEAPPPVDSRVGRHDPRILITEFRPDSLKIAQRISERAKECGMTAGQFAFNWVINSVYISAAVAGPRTLEQWCENLGALAFTLTAEDEAFIDSLVSPGHPSTPGYTDPQYPVTGRVARA